ncbi:MAG: redox-regulated ATPase YchF [Candidatus Micrarchaeota archaeon]
MQIGLVGKPSSGKSSFFSAATLVDVAIASYPFTTIEPNKGIGFVRVSPCSCKDFNMQCNPRTGFCVNSKRFVPVEIIDVAGLVPDAHKGIGMGNQFLDDLRQADVLIHVVDASGSTNEKGELVSAGTHDPCLDVEFLEKEIDLWFFSVIKRNWNKFCRSPFESKREMFELMSQNFSGIGVSFKHLSVVFDSLSFSSKKLIEWTDEELMFFARKLRVLSKPIVVAANKADLNGAKENIKKLQEKFPGLSIVPCSALAEFSLKKAAKQGLIEYFAGDSSFKELTGLSPEQEKGLNYFNERVLSVFNSTGVQEVLEKAVFGVLGFIAIYPAGTKGLTDSEGRVLPDCFLMPPGSTALDFAFKLHTDFGENFIAAINVKTRQQVSKDYVLKHRDAIEIRANK